MGSFNLMESTLGLWLATLLGAAFAIAVVVVVMRIALAALERLARPMRFAPAFLEAGRLPVQLTVGLLALQTVWLAAPDHLPLIELVRHLNTLLLITVLAWTAVACVTAAREVIVALQPGRIADERRARRIQTQTQVLTRALVILIVIIAIGAALMTFPGARQLGTSLLASAGIGGLILGFAARPVLSNLIAGLQIAMTEPFRIDDVLWVEGQWTWVEEVTATYVVLRVWDERRMVVPLEWFVANPFENWSRRSEQLSGTVFLWVDYRMPVEALRAEGERLCAEDPDWDGRTCRTQITDTSDRAMQVRLLVSAASSTALWDLRCRLRERLIDFVQREHPEFLPRLRAEVLDAAHATPTGAPPAPAPADAGAAR